MYESAIAWLPFDLGEGKRREATRGGAPTGKNYPVDTIETLWLQSLLLQRDDVTRIAETMPLIEAGFLSGISYAGTDGFIDPGPCGWYTTAGTSLRLQIRRLL